MKIAIIGAGPCGLEALRHCLEEGHDCVVFEKTDKIGGTWVYNENIGTDTNGLPIHSSMYSNLMTNLPKELMEYADFPYKEPYHSFISQAEVLKYINNFAKTFDLLSHIKFLTHVVKVTPLSKNRWKVEAEDLLSKHVDEKEFDVILVCVGNYSVPRMPKFEGIELFKGSVIHSHNYRKPEPYKNQKVLIIGSGPSAIDLARILVDVADKVFLSFRGDTFYSFNPNFNQKPIVKQFKEKTAVFNDNSEEEIDSVIFCTGYLYTYPFLTPECGIEVENNWIKYLYKHIINVKKPTMAFLGIPSRIVPFPLFGMQELAAAKRTRINPNRSCKEQASFYSTGLLAVIAMTAGSSLLFLVPLYVDPAISTLASNFVTKPVTCVTTRKEELTGLANCSWSSCREGCTSDAYHCTHIFVSYNDTEDEDNINLIEDAILLVNIKGCGYPPKVICSNFTETYGAIGTEFPCYHSRENRTVVLTQYGRNEQIAIIIHYFAVPFVITLATSVALCVMHCDCRCHPVAHPKKSRRPPRLQDLSDGSISIGVDMRQSATYNSDLVVIRPM